MIFRIKKFISLVAILTLVFSSQTSAQNSAPEQAELIPYKSSELIHQLIKIDGYWVAEKYLASLKDNKSPFVGNPESLEINAREKRVRWLNYHEAYWRNILQYGIAGGQYFLKVSEAESTMPSKKLTYFSIADKKLVFTSGELVELLNEPFVRIPVELPVYANGLVLVGEYHDSEGKSYEFTQDGRAIWPDLIFNYEFVLDSSEAGCPYINSNASDSEGRGKRFGYKWFGAQLNVYEIIYDADYYPIDCANNPLFTLTKKMH